MLKESISFGKHVANVRVLLVAFHAKCFSRVRNRHEFLVEILKFDICQVPRSDAGFMSLLFGRWCNAIATFDKDRFIS